VSADKVIEQTQNSIKPRERSVTRVVAILLGVVFVVACPASVLIHGHLRAELESGSPAKVVQFACASLLCAALGVLFIVAGVTGHAPTWFQNCARKR
jgi:cytochrome bd-type quinol oxidase subunit 2